jgi:prepilin-type N-terminal cleavage/methylation domain
MKSYKLGVKSLARPLDGSTKMRINKPFRPLWLSKDMHPNKPLARPLSPSDYMHLNKPFRPLAFSIIELLLVLTIVSIFLGAVFIGYRTIHATTNEQDYAYKARTFVLGLKDYYDVLGAYPQISCTDGNSWSSLNGDQGICDWNSHPPSNPADCCALLHFIGPWATTWSYLSNSTSFAIVTSQIPNEYVQAVSNAFNSLGLLCTVSSTGGDYSYLSCTANNVPTTLTALNQ